MQDIAPYDALHSEVQWPLHIVRSLSICLPERSCKKKKKAFFSALQSSNVCNFYSYTLHFVRKAWSRTDCAAVCLCTAACYSKFCLAVALLYLSAPGAHVSKNLVQFFAAPNVSNSDFENAPQRRADSAHTSVEAYQIKMQLCISRDSWKCLLYCGKACFYLLTHYYY